MYILIGAAAFVTGIVVCAAVLVTARRADKTRRPKRKGQPENRRRLEFSKFVLTLVLLTYFIGVGVGVWVIIIDNSQLGIVLAFIGTPTAAAIGFYIWKAKAENVIKIKKDNPVETTGIPVDLNNINT